MGESPSPIRRTQTATFGALTAVMGIAAALSCGLSVPVAHADGDGATSASGRSGTGRSAHSATGSRGPAAVSRRPVGPSPAAALARPVVIPTQSSAAASGLAQKLPTPAAAVAATAPRATVVSPPIAAVPLPAESITNPLTSLAGGLKGGVPTTPADAALALMLGVARRQATAQSAASRMSAPAAVAAGTATTTVIEGESMTRSGSTSVVSDKSASGGSTVALRGTASVATTVNLPTAAVLTFRVRATGGAPNMKLSIDGVPYTTLMVVSTSYGDYKFTGGISAGTHTVAISSTTANASSALYVDKLSVTSGPIVESFSGGAGSAPGSLWTARSGSGFDAGTETYSASNAVLDGQGNLVLKATRGSNNVYNSGWVWTKNNLSFGYGTVTTRAKVPKGQGLWPSIWMMGADSDTVGWPASGEIDIAELPSTTTTLYSTLHGPITGTSATQQAQIASNLPDLSTDYHNYWVTHLPDKIIFGIDNQTLGTLTPSNLAPGGQWVYNRPMYFIMNLSVGGPWAGAPNSSTPSTANMLIDSVTFAPA